MGGDRWGVGRRAMLQAGLASLTGLAGAALPPVTDAQAAERVTPNPIKPRIARSGLAVELVEFCAPPRTSGAKPYAMLNFLYHAGDGSGRLFANDSRGKLWLIDPRTGACRLFLDLASARGAAFLTSGPPRGETRGPQMGFRSFAFHPNFGRSGAPGHRRLYTVSTETARSRPAHVRLFDAPFPVAFHDVVAEWSVDPGDPARVDPGSRRELLRIAQYRRDHNTDQLMFDPNARPGDAGYGTMLIGVGDGGNSPSHTDPYSLAQNPLRALGKILRIVPLAQPGGGAYGIPSDNPFRGDGRYLPEIWALGLRHPQNLSFDRAGSGALLLSDIGQSQIEEVNLGRKGANYGWPAREGTFVTDRFNPGVLYAPTASDHAKGFIEPVAQYDHSEGAARGVAAITGGFVYRGRAVPGLVGHYLFGDIIAGRVFHVPVSELRLGRQATVKELTLTKGGKVVTLKGLVDGANGRVDLRFGQDEAGEVLIVTKQDGRIRKLART